MSRIELKGQGGPIPTIGLPDPNLSSDLPVQTLLLPHGIPFLKVDYVGLGYTHFQVDCIGACGGNGGYGTGSPTGRAYPWAVIPGGAGGGGGLHRVSGMLSDLPDACPVVVGQPGADGRNDNGDWKHLFVLNPDGTIKYPYQYYLNPNHVSALPGDDGGYSSVNGSTCMASGGKGGLEAPQFKSHIPENTHQTRGPGGDGGEGGAGGRTVAGGGAPGAWTDETVDEYGRKIYNLKPPKDGSWDGTIGQGGGGGRGGGYYHPGYPLYIAPQLAADELMHADIDVTVWEASAGGQGSFSYTDTSVYGVRQARQMYTGRGISAPIIGGVGGGARLTKLQGYGSKAPGFSPQGAVQIRIFKVT